MDEIVVNKKHYPNCRFLHKAEAVARVRFKDGCFCYEDKEQDLCEYHLDRAYPIPYKVLFWYKDQNDDQN